MSATTPDDGRPDPVMTRLGEAISLGQQGRRAEARGAFAALWVEIGADGDPLHRLTLAHHMADVQDDPREELAWDERALAEAEGVSDDRAAAAGATGPVAAFYPSLHLNLADVHHRLGNPAAARRHLYLGRQAAGVLPDDGYGRMIRQGLAGLAERLSGEETSASR